MQKLLYILLVSLILTFFLSTYKYYSSNKNLKNKEFNRNNIDQIINEKISNLPVLTNDTDNIIQFNNSISDKINNEKTRSFWDLLKSE
mgnify:CR=1 FL=1|tara:strand:- start:143 stop:406 length:264 start_codon:yes stop_codon:yes gene_type:complete